MARSIRTKEAVAGEPPVRVINKTYSGADEHRQVMAIDEGGGEGTAETLVTDFAKNATLLTIASSLASVASALTALATSAKQDTGNSSLATIAGKDFATQTTLALIKAQTDKIPSAGQATMASSTPVTIASDQSAVAVSMSDAVDGIKKGVDIDATVDGLVAWGDDGTGKTGALKQSLTAAELAPAALATAANQATIIGHIDGLESTATTIAGKDFATQTTLALIKAQTDKIPSLGQALAAASVPVVLTAAQQSALTPPAAITGFATEAKQDTGNSSLATIAGKDFATQTTLALIKAQTDKIPALGQALAAGSVPVVLTADQVSTLTPPAAITNFANETGGNLAGLVARVGEVQATPTANTLLGRLKDLLTGIVLAAGTNAIGKLAANSGIDIGDVDVLSVPVSDNFDPVLGKTFITKSVDVAASGTGTVIWTPASGKKFVITDIDFSAITAGTICIFDGTDATTTRVSKWNVAATGGFVRAYKKPYVSAAANNVLKYTTGAVITGYLTVNGYEI